MEHLLGLLKVNVQKGVNLAVRDVRSSDPYVIVKMGSQVPFYNSSPAPVELRSLEIADSTSRVLVGRAFLV